MENLNPGGQSGASVDQLLRMGIDTAKKGNREGAKVILRQVLQQDRRSDLAWMWLAYVESDPIQRRRFLENAVRINPDNAAARRALNKMNTRTSASQNQTMLYGGIVLAVMIVLSILACIVALAL
jgi:hypothetical protein